MAVKNFFILDFQTKQFHLFLNFVFANITSLFYSKLVNIYILNALSTTLFTF